MLTLGHSAKLQFTPDFTQTIQENFLNGSFGLGQKVANISGVIQQLIAEEETQTTSVVVDESENNILPPSC